MATLKHFIDPEKVGWVYLIKIEDYFKVGITTNRLKGRYDQYRSHSPFDVFMVKAVYVEKCMLLEECIHDEFFPDREWSKLEIQDEMFISYEMDRWQKRYGVEPPKVSPLESPMKYAK